MTTTPRPHTPPARHPNQFGLRGWVYAGRYSFERYLYTLHRLTGLGLVAYLLLHIIETGQRLAGGPAWAALMALFATPVFKALEYLLFGAFVFHTLNGVRLHFTELGFLLGRPAQPVYPYPSSIRRHRPLTYVLMILAGLIVLLGGTSLFFA
jgi:succinate dehydrogenase / fumarate reductase cytochrome b subunit